MVHSTDGDFSRPPTELIARMLLESARQDPALLGRSRPPMSMPSRLVEPDPPAVFPLLVETPGPVQPSNPLQLVSETPTDVNRQFEDLVSLALASAREAEDASDEARAASSSARRSMRVMAMVSVVGILLGVAAIADNHLFSAGATVAATAVAGPGSGSADAPVLADRGPDLAPPPAEAQMAPPAASAGPPAAAAVVSDVVVPTAPPPRPISPPVYHAPTARYAAYAAPWPSDRQTHARYRTVATRRTYVPPFLMALRRDISSLLRGFPPHS